MDREEKFLKSARRILHGAETNLDADTVARLRAARRQALDSGHQRASRPTWLLPLSGFATAAVVLAVAGLLWFAAPSPSLVQANLNDIEMITAPENPEFYSDLEFYDWLDASTDSDAS